MIVFMHPSQVSKVVQFPINIILQLQICIIIIIIYSSNNFCTSDKQCPFLTSNTMASGVLSAHIFGTSVIIYHLLRLYSKFGFSTDSASARRNSCVLNSNQTKSAVVKHGFSGSSPSRLINFPVKIAFKQRNSHWLASCEIFPKHLLVCFENFVLKIHISL